MRCPDYMEDDANSLISNWKSIEAEIKNKEQIWIRKSLETLYNYEDVLEFSIRPNPYAVIRDYIVGNKKQPHIMMPKFLATQNLEFYWAELNGVDLFLVSIFNYENKISGNEIMNFCIADSIKNKQHLISRMNIAIRKFLSYQYVILD